IDAAASVMRSHRLPASSTADARCQARYRLDRLISMTAINVLAGSRAMRDRLKLFNVSMGSSIGSQRTMEAISTPPPQHTFHHGMRGRGGTIFQAALPSDERQVQADMRTHLIHRPARDIIPPLGGARVSFYWIRCCTVFMLPPRLVPGSTGTRCRQPRCGA